MNVAGEFVVYVGSSALDKGALPSGTVYCTE